MGAVGCDRQLAAPWRRCHWGNPWAAPGLEAWDELVEDVGKACQIGQLAAWRRPRVLVEAVDPDGGEAELGRRDDVVEVALRDVNVTVWVGPGPLREGREP